ncbi:twin transmembrane helix small protein [Pseudomonas caspiana]|uniref:MFS transporter n=1 Tax=Pseudomonas caspiana TaxID=1451454 RepID=A0A1Y3NWX5_9PSED|nr:twin transmembrane helix small protein [Pseudomonas caspiana]OUM72088.1 MFS transporter [Pseudomonas caspiana]
MLKIAIVLLLIATVACLFSGLFFLARDGSRSTRLLKALTLRVSLAVVTLALIAWGFYSGQLV